MLRKIYQELVSIRKELQAIRSSLEHHYKINSGELSEKIKSAWREDQSRLSQLWYSRR